MIDTTKPYLFLIPRVYQADCLVCENCHQNVNYCGTGGSGDGVVGSLFSCSCSSCLKIEGEWYVYESDYDEFPWILCEPGWIKQCKELAWDSDYFYDYFSSHFGFFQHYLQYCFENQTCQCYWPEISPLAGTINNEAYICYKALVPDTNDELYDTEDIPEEEFDLRILDPNYLPNWSHLTIHGKAMSLVIHTFFYSQYHQGIINASKYIDQDVSLDFAPTALSHLSHLLVTIQPYFLELYSDCLKKHPHPKIYYERGMLRFHMGDITGSIQDMHAYMEYADNNEDLLTSDMYLQEGRAYIEEYSYDEAIQALTKAIKKDPSNKEAFFERSIAYFELGLFDESLEDYLASEMKSKAAKVSAMTQGLCAGILQGGAESLVGLLDTVDSLGRGLWAFAINPIAVSQELVDLLCGCVDFIRHHSTAQLTKEVSPELFRLITSWPTLSEHERGELAGYVIGKFGIDAFAINRATTLYRQMKRANALLSLEAMATSAVNRATFWKLLLRSVSMQIKKYRRLPYAIFAAT